MAKKTYLQGTCQYCDQEQAVEACDSQEAADELATLQCECTESKKAAKAAESEQERKDKRETTLEDARADIDDLFGDSADERGEQSLPEDERDLLFEAAKLVYDQAWRSVLVKVTQGFSLKISVTNKGKLTIQRDDSTTRKREHK